VTQFPDDETPDHPLDRLATPVAPAFDGLQVAFMALPTGAYRSVSASAEGPHGEIVTITFSAGGPDEDPDEP
jgi:hypothetical protein